MEALNSSFRWKPYFRCPSTHFHLLRSWLPLWWVISSEPSIFNRSDCKYYKPLVIVSWCKTVGCYLPQVRSVICFISTRQMYADHNFNHAPCRSELAFSACPAKEWGEVACRVVGPTLATLLKMQNTFTGLRLPSPWLTHPSSQWKLSASFSNLQISQTNKFEGLEDYYFQMSLKGGGLPRRNSDYGSVEYWDKR